MEQILNFKLRGPGPSGRTSTLVIFMTKQKFLKENLPKDYYKILSEAMYLNRFLLPGRNHLQNLTPKCKILTCFRLRLLVKRGLNNLIFSIGF